MKTEQPYGRARQFSREFKKRRRRRREQSRLKNEPRDTVKSFGLFLTVKTISKLNMEHSVKLEIEI